VGKPEGKRPLGRPISEMDHGERVLGDMDWCGLAQDRDM
jgi:hypothetical protein